MLFGGLDIRVPHNSAYFAQGFYASMGFAVPAALGAQIGSGMRPLVMCGDGGFQMTGPEISQAPAKGANPIVRRDQQWRMGHLPADCRAARPARDSAVAVRATRARLGRRGFRGARPSSSCATRCARRIDCKSFAIIDVQVERDDLSPVTVKYIKAAAKRSQAPARARGARKFARMTDEVNATTYRRVYREFRWETPEYFNFGEVIDKFAEDPQPCRDPVGRQRGQARAADLRRYRGSNPTASPTCCRTRHSARRPGHAGAAAHHAVAGRVYRRAQGSARS